MSRTRTAAAARTAEGTARAPARAKRPPSLTKARAQPFLEPLARMVPEPRCELDWTTPFELLVATQLSAQSTDAMVNRVTPALFARWPDAHALAAADPAEVEAVIHRTGFFRQKARHAIATARLLVERHGGEVPRSMAALVELPGTARKTAAVVLGTAFGIAEGIPVDTHVFRVTARWGWHAERTPARVEAMLMRVIPREQWPDFGHRAVLFGRHHCTARAPQCGACAMHALCPSAKPAAQGPG
ncbi:MAG: glycosylase and apyrimidinic lyase [Pseudomonadota bacterium]